MLSAYTGSQIRAAEAPLLEAGYGDALMQRAAHGLAQVAGAELRDTGGIYGRAVVVLAGSGNNGGDALYAGARLAGRGAGTTAILTSERVHVEALVAFRAAGGRVEQLTDDRVDALAMRIASAALVIDGILGTGGSGGLRGAAAKLVQQVNARGVARVVACDLPSGIDADTGEAAGEILPADVTATFGGVKTGLLAGAGARAAGRVVTIDIGLTQSLPPAAAYSLEPEDLRQLYARPGPTDHKYSRGVLGIAAGSAMYPGAAVLATGAALGTGVGMVRFLGPPTVASLINAVHPEVVCSQGSVPESHVQAWLVGPGATEDPGQRQRARDAIASGLPTVVDAGALPLLPEKVGEQVILTPHAGELAALFQRRGEDVERVAIEATPAYFARRAAATTGATVLLKGYTTVVAAPGGELFIQSNATPWLATAGSGDTLAGILGALVATNAGNDDVAAPLGLPPSSRWAALGAAAATLHGLAGRRAARRGPVMVGELPRHVGRVLAELL
ncbi:hydroxyethylthiazole kinase-like uncharacterized protein yjeF [Arthrobacter pigmenti]|uniref:Bifunctional NAD(P)H-hydrate repair enzyme n=1 Tax=Arthrobacter pigmenti TaxID=271432 RepID=A0A846RIS5_9MICC|nr:NAD(P)H-hydrate epimerase [Arthrobacter pigmenti]NJC23113.1 hydroxyethylthiazole kinase-like uncharacterized protein yjeF [Arthrobacter pigmenti]